MWWLEQKTVMNRICKGCRSVNKRFKCYGTWYEAEIFRILRMSMPRISAEQSVETLPESKLALQRTMIQVENKHLSVIGISNANSINDDKITKADYKTSSLKIKERQNYNRLWSCIRQLIILSSYIIKGKKTWQSNNFMMKMKLCCCCYEVATNNFTFSSILNIIIFNVLRKIQFFPGKTCYP